MTKFRSTYIFQLFTVAVLLFACKKPDSGIGLGLQPDSDVLSLVTVDTLTLNFTTVDEDSLATDEMSIGVLGTVFYPRFGTTYASIATQLRLSAPNIDFGSNAVADSVVFRMHMSGDNWGTLTPHTIEVHPLLDTLSLDSTYYSNYNPWVSDENLVDFSQGPVSIYSEGDEINGEDTVSDYLELKLNTAWGQTLIEQDTNVFSTNSNWLEYFPGIVISSSNGQGATGIDISSGFSVVRLHYHNDVDTSFYDLQIAPLSARVNLFQHDYTTNLAVFNEPGSEHSLPGDEFLYVMSGSGVKAQLEIPYLAALNDSLGEGRAVQKAELILPVDKKYFSKRYGAHDHLFILTEDAEGTAIATPDQGSAAVNIDGFYDQANGEYRFNISRTIQQILNRETGAHYGNFSPEHPVPPLHVVSSRAGISIQGVVIRGTDVEENPAKLVLTLSH